MNNELYFGIALSLIKGIGDINAKQLISYAGGVEQLFKMSSARLQKISGVGQKIAAKFENTKEAFIKAEQELKFIEKNNIQALFYFDKRYPKRLLNCADAPLILYCKGNFDFNKERFVNVIGTRHATEQGKEITENLIIELSKYGVNLVSGLAFGIDICAHKAANKVGMQNIAVLAHGLDRLYPAQHKNIAEKMQENGALVSDYISGTNLDRQNFPDRNRIVAGMTDATIVVESAVSGGALITAEFANNYNKDVFAFPGRISDEYSAGCLNLIKNHKAQLITSANDIIDCMNWDSAKTDTIASPIQPQLFLDLNEQEEKIYTILKQQEKVHIDLLTQQAQFPMSILSSVLLQLEMKGVVVSLPGKQYKIIA